MTLSEKIRKQADVCKKLENTVKNLKEDIRLLNGVVKEGGTILMSAQFLDLNINIPAEIIVQHLEIELKGKEKQLYLMGEWFKSLCGQNDVQK